MFLFCLQILQFFLAFGPFTEFFFLKLEFKNYTSWQNIEICKLLMKIISSLIQQANGKIFLNLQDLIKKNSIIACTKYSKLV